MVYGAEFGIAPATAIQNIFVTDEAKEGKLLGKKPAFTAQAIIGVAMSQGVEFKYPDVGMVKDEATVLARRTGEQEWTPFTFTNKMAEKMGLLGKHNWRRMPQQMLVARASASAARYMSSIAGSLYTVEELNPDIELSDDGSVVTLEYEVKQEKKDNVQKGVDFKKLADERRKPAKEEPAPPVEKPIEKPVEEAPKLTVKDFTAYAKQFFVGEKSQIAQQIEKLLKAHGHSMTTWSLKNDTAMREIVDRNYQFRVEFETLMADGSVSPEDAEKLLDANEIVYETVLSGSDDANLAIQSLKSFINDMALNNIVGEEVVAAEEFDDVAGMFDEDEAVEEIEDEDDDEALMRFVSKNK